MPDIEVRLTDSFRRSRFTLAYLDQVTPGNGVYLTSRNNSGNASYSYSGVRHWNFGGEWHLWPDDSALVQTVGAYTTYGAGVGVTRDLGKGLHSVLRLDARPLRRGRSVGIQEHRVPGIPRIELQPGRFAAGAVVAAGGHSSSAA